MRDYLAVTMPGERKVMWLAEESPGDTGRGIPPLGGANILMLGDIGVLEIIVQPKARRAGVGRELLTQIVRRATSEGFKALGVEVPGKTTGIDFYERFGFSRAFIEMRSVLDFGSVNWDVLASLAEKVGAGYKLDCYAGGPPLDMYEAYAMAKAEVREAYDLGDLELRPSSYEPQRLEASINTLAARGLKLYVVVATQETTGEVAGLTEVVVPLHHPTRADQYDTVVVPRHRGYGIGRAIKARMLLELRAAEPAITQVQTWNPEVNEPLIRVNHELGFVPDRLWLEYEADVPSLAKRLGVS